MITPDLSLPIPEHIGAAHFIGIGGSGMSGLARMFLAAGIPVSGSDRADSAALRDLERAGATVYVGHDAATPRRRRHGDPHGCHLAPEPGVRHGQAARDARHPPFAGPVLADRRAPARLGRRGARQDDLHGNDRHGSQGARGGPELRERRRHRAAWRIERHGADDLFVVEADESDGTFLLYDTSVALITNIDADHLDHYGSAEAFDDAFARSPARHARPW